MLLVLVCLVELRLVVEMVSHLVEEMVSRLVEEMVSRLVEEWLGPQGSVPGLLDSVAEHHPAVCCPQGVVAAAVAAATAAAVRLVQVAELTAEELTAGRQMAAVLG